MLVEIKVPQLAESVSEATLLEWQKGEGEVVEQGELLVEIETDKVVLEVAAPSSGLLRSIHRPSGSSVTSGELIATLDTEYATEVKTQESAPPQVMSRSEARAEGLATEPALSPAVRRLVAEHQLDPSRIPTTGRGGRLLKTDVLAWLEAHPPAAPEPPEPTVPPAPGPMREPSPLPPQGLAATGERREPISRLRARIAERLVEAQHTAAILTTFNEVDMTAVQALRARHQARFRETHGVKLGHMGLFTRACVLALQRFPRVNAFIDGDQIVYHEASHIGVAVGTPRGLVVPVVRDAQDLGIAAIERAIRDFAERAQGGKLRPEELMDGTFTISNGGVYGSLLSTPILNPPQSGILGMHSIQDRPVAVDGQVVVRPMMYLALSYDHRLVDGREAVRFLVTVKEALEDPARLLLDL